MKAFITGISGQTGSYLAELLLEGDYDVYGISRRHSVVASQISRLESIKDKITITYGDMTDQVSLEKALTEIKPDLIFNLAAQSHVRISFDIPFQTAQINALGVLGLLEAYRRICPEAKFIQSSSSEMFGLSVDDDKFQRETTIMNPTSPYGVSKVFGYNMVRHYRRAYNLHACNGIMFNMESPRRGENFVTQKVIKTAVEIKLGLAEKLELGNMDSYRDWGHAKDYAMAIYKIITHPTADDFVISSQQTHSVREMCDTVFHYLGMDYRDFVTQNPIFLRPEEVPYLRGDSTKARTILKWQPSYDFQGIIWEMCDFWMEKLKS